MTLPSPQSSFTIPSLHDDLELDCRIYFPRGSHPEKNQQGLGRSFAIIAHPYAPLGGSYDDPVVALAGSVLLKQGFVLGTFNFRGAHGSAGRTSWSGKAELGDYVAFYGFMLCFISFVLREIDHHEPGTNENQQSCRLLLGGYSYGSLIASCLPPLELVSMLFQQVQDGSAESEIKVRAEQLARDLVGYVELHRAGVLGSRPTESPSSPSRGLLVGGYESETANRRVSRETSRKSLDAEKIRRSVDRTRQRILARTKSDQSIHTAPTPARVQSLSIVMPRITYLIISPILPPISGFTTMFSKPTFERVDTQTQKVKVRDTTSKDEKFLRIPTCVIHGTKDVFTQSRKVQKWAHGLRDKAGVSFRADEIEGAGHFWIEEDAPRRLQASITSWISSFE